MNWRPIIISVIIFLVCVLITIGFIALRIYIKKKQEELSAAEKKQIADDYVLAYEKAALKKAKDTENNVEDETTDESTEKTTDEPIEETTDEPIKPSKPSKPCDRYIDSSTNLSISCLQQIWKDAGCTNTERIFDNEWYKAQNMKTIKEDSKKWATLDDDLHKIGCYGDKSTTVDNILKDLTSTNTLISMASAVAIEYAIKKIRFKVLAKVAFKIQQKGLMLTAKIVKNVGQKLGIKALQKLGIRAGEKAAVKVGVKVAATSAKIATKVATSTAVAASTGPAFPFVAATLLAFDILSFGLDMGDAGGYNKMSTIESYLEIQKQIDQEMKRAFQDNDGEWPSVVGPLDSMTEDDLMKQMTELTNNIMNYNPNKPEDSDPLIRPMNEKLTSDLKNGIITNIDLADDSIMDKYLSMIDMDKVYNKAFASLCTSKNGKIIDNNKCSYKNKQSCDASYNWPPGENETYVEYKSNVLGGACVVASAAVRTMCNEIKVGYNTETGLCDINELYCKRKGADWSYNSKIKQNDCMINDGQNVAENIFGTTITRGLKQIFDPAQYENCNLDEKDDGYFCRSTKCGDDQEPDIAGGICHTKCKPNYTSDGITACWENCPRYGEIKVKDKCVTLPNGNTNNGTQPALWDCNIPTSQQFYFNGDDSTIKSLKNTNKCLDVINGNVVNKQKLQLWDCNNSDAQKFTYDSKKRFVSQKNTNLCIGFNNNISNGSQIQLEDCNDTDGQVFEMEKTTNLGAQCRKSSGSRVADCPTGYTNNGATCGRGADSKSSDFGLGPYESADCPPSYTNTGTTCHRWGTSFQREYFSRAGESIDYDYKSCEDKFGKGNCEIEGVWGSRLARPKTCEIEARYLNLDYPDKYVGDGMTTMGSRCYIHAHTIGTIGDHGVCPPSNDVSKKYTNKIGALCYVDCEKEYGSGYFNNLTSCWRHPDTKLMDSMTCNEGEFKSAARCYPNPFPGFKNEAETAVYNKTQYNRGVGSPSVQIRAKKRIADFSTQDN